MICLLVLLGTHLTFLFVFLSAEQILFSTLTLTLRQRVSKWVQKGVHCVADVSTVDARMSLVFRFFIYCRRGAFFLVEGEFLSLRSGRMCDVCHKVRPCVYTDEWRTVEVP